MGWDVLEGDTRGHNVRKFFVLPLVSRGILFT